MFIHSFFIFFLSINDILNLIYASTIKIKFSFIMILKNIYFTLT